MIRSPAFDAGFLGRAAGDDLDDLQRSLGTLELDAEADEVPFDLRIDVVQLVAGQVSRILVERSGGPAGVFENRGRQRQSQHLAGQLGGRGNGFLRVLTIADIAYPQHRFDLLKAGLQFGRGGPPAQVLLDEGFLAQGHLQSLVAALHEGLPVGLDDVMRLNLEQHFRVQRHGVPRGKRGERLEEAGVVVAPAQIVVDLGDVVPNGQVLIAGMLAQALFIQIDGLAPAQLRFEKAAAFHDVGRVVVAGVRRRRDDADLGLDGRGERTPQQSGGDEATEPQDLALHTVFRSGRAGSLSGLTGRNDG